MAELKHWQSLFIAEYLKNGFNGTQAYLTIKPQNTLLTAQVESCKLLKTPKVKSLLQRERALVDATSLATREVLIVEAHEAREMAKATKNVGGMNQSTELKGKLSGVFQQDSDTGKGYMNLIKSISVTINNDNRVVSVKSAQDGSGRQVKERAYHRVSVPSGPDPEPDEAIVDLQEKLFG